MIEASAHLVDHVIPPVPTRQWVLTFPWPLRLLFASQPDTLSRVLAVVIRAIETDLIRRAGLTRRSHARTGVVTLIQRFGSALNLNVHLHMIVLDGVYTEHNGQAQFHHVGAPSRGTLERLLDRLIKRALRVLLRDGTTHLLFTPADFIARLAALIPRPRHNLTRYHGVFAPGAPLRRLIVPTPTSARKRPTPKDSANAPENQPLKPTQAPITPTDPPTAPLTWAQRLKRVFEIDITLCPLGGGQLRVIADITEPELITRILDHIQNRAPPSVTTACPAPL